MNELALGWLRALTRPTTTPPPPAPLRHTVPPVSTHPPAYESPFPTTGETLADLRAYEFRCSGMCPGGCPTCDGIADQISEARLITDIRQLRAREAELTQQITALREGTR